MKHVIFPSPPASLPPQAHRWRKRTINTEAGAGETALGRGRLVEDRIEGFEVIFSQEPKIEGGNNFGNRIVFSPEGHIFLALGERFQFSPAQGLSNHLGAVVRLNKDGSVPEDNPVVGQENALELRPT